MNIYLYDRYDPKRDSSARLAQNLALKYGWGTFFYTPEGRPQLEHGCISISHSKHYWILSYDTHAHGLDIEVHRELTPMLIDRFNLNIDDPLFDWCSREAYFKLSQDKSALFNALPSTFTAHRVEHPRLCIAIVNASHQMNEVHLHTI